MTTTAPARDVLTQTEAEARAAHVSNVRYEIALDITRGAETYRGDVTIHFHCAGEGDTFLDFRGKRITASRSTARRARRREWTGYRLTLPADALAASEHRPHRLRERLRPHRRRLPPVHRPRGRRRVPLLELRAVRGAPPLPLLRPAGHQGARYALTVTAPAEWEVIANSREDRATTPMTAAARARSRRRSPSAPTSSRSSPGPTTPSARSTTGSQLGFFCRKSLVEHLDTDEVFTITKQGLDFYAEFFDYPYPFDKYDQVFVPEFNAGAMENVGCVTHNEYMVFRDPPTENQRREPRRDRPPRDGAHVVRRPRHDALVERPLAERELRHLHVLPRADGGDALHGGWQDFNSGIKNWAYRQDQLVTTHPIAGRSPTPTRPS